MYKKDLSIGNPKKFQRRVEDIASSVLFSKGYYLNGQHSQRPYLNANGIVNIADFMGVLYFVKNHKNYNRISRIIGICLVVFSSLHMLYPIITSTSFSSYDLLNFPAWIGIIIGIGLIVFKFGKDICIKITLVGEGYRTNVIKEKNSIEYLGVRSDARLTVRGDTLDPGKSLSNSDYEKLREDGHDLIEKLTPFLIPFLEETK